MMPFKNLTRNLRSWRVAGLLLAVVIIVGLPFAVIQSNARDTQEAAGWVNHSGTVKALTFEIGYLMRDSEAATYRMLIGDGTQLTRDRAEHAGKEVPGLIQQLLAATSDNADQQVQIGALQSMVDGRLTMLAQAIRQLDQSDQAGARTTLREGMNLFKMNTQIALVTHNEDVLLQSRRDTAHHEYSNGQLVLAITAVAQLLLLIIIVITSERQIDRRETAESSEHLAVRRSMLILQTMSEPVALLDENLRCLLVNAAFNELYGRDAERSQPLDEIGQGAWSDSALLQRLRDVMLRDRELWDYDMTQRTVDGMERHVVINARRLQQRESDVPALLLTVSDVTARALGERRIAELNRQLEGKVSQISDVNRELEAFSYSVSHDLRAPLRHISGFARKLEHHLGDIIDEKSGHYIEVIASSAQRMGLLIDDLLVFSRLGRSALRLQVVDTQSLVEEARAMVMADPVLATRTIDWRVDQLPMVVGDENMLRTVWQNLLGNAVKYTGQKGAARIEVSAEQGQNGDFEFTVADNGVGFDMQYSEKLFGVFQRLHRASEFIGNGIGLANVRRIIARHGGRVWAEGEPGRGAHFHFSLPAVDLGSLSSKSDHEQA